MRLNRLTDYASLILAALSEDAEHWHAASTLADQLHLPLTTVAKVLKLLTKAGLLRASRGKQGGYQLAMAPQEIRLSQIISAIEGPVYLTECTDVNTGQCPLEAYCGLKKPWRQMNQLIIEMLNHLSLSDLLKSEGACK